MRSEAEMLGLIQQVAGQLPQVQAVAMSGSRVDPNAPKDRFQDYDVVYLVTDKTELLADRAWLQPFGEILISQTPEESTLFPATLGERFTFLMLFTDGNRIDLTLCPLTAIDDWLAAEPMIKVLSDPFGLLDKRVVSNESAFLTQAPIEAEFADCCNEFWWVATYVVKGLWRRELLYATDHLYGICQQELLRLLGWQVVVAKGTPVALGKNYKYLPDFLADPENRRLNQLRDFTSIEKCWQSLFATIDLFDQQAKKLAGQTGFRYDSLTGEKLTAYAQKWYQTQVEEKR